MLIAPIDAVSATAWDPTDWDKKLKDLEAMKYVLFIGVDRPHSRIVQLAQADDCEIMRPTPLFTPQEPRSLPTKTLRSACPSRMICRSCIEDQTARLPTCISTPRPRSPCHSRPSPPVTNCKPMSKTSRSNTLLPRIPTRTSTFIFKRPA